MTEGRRPAPTMVTAGSTPTEQVLASMQLRGAEAVWVLSAHVYALVVPLVFCTVIIASWDYLVATTYNPSLFFIAACLLASGGAFEAAQNTVDNWYLTPDSPSVNGVGLLDFLFYLTITAGQAVSAIALAGDRWWVVAIAVGAILAVPPVYFLGGPYFAPLSVSSLLAIGLAYEAFGNPVVFLQLLAVAATMYFFGLLIRTQAQVLHGFTTLLAASGVWFLIWGISGGMNNSPTSWAAITVISIVAIVAGLALRPVLLRLPATPRPAQ